MGPVGSVNASTSPVLSEELTPDNKEIGFPQVIANLIVSEAACLSIHSDVRCNPLTDGYNLKVLPATYDKAMRRPDADNWLAAMHKEINLMSEMNVYELTMLPTDRCAIGC
jgi:hypothetical protein